MKLLSILVLFFTLSVGDVCSAPGNGNGKGKGSEKGKGKGKGKYAKGNDLHEEAAETIATTISVETGQPSEKYTVYAANLADTLGQMDDATLARIFGDKIGMLP